MLRRTEFRLLADKINKEMEWQYFGLEMWMYSLVALVTPPFAAHLMVSMVVVRVRIIALLLCFASFLS